MGIGAIAWAPLRIKRDKCDIYLRGKIKGKGKSEKVTVVVVVAVVCNIFTVHVAPGVTVEAILRCCSNSSESDSTKKHLGRKEGKRKIKVDASALGTTTPLDRHAGCAVCANVMDGASVQVGSKSYFFFLKKETCSSIKTNVNYCICIWRGASVRGGQLPVEL